MALVRYVLVKENMLPLGIKTEQELEIQGKEDRIILYEAIIRDKKGE